MSTTTAPNITKQSQGDIKVHTLLGSTPNLLNAKIKRRSQLQLIKGDLEIAITRTVRIPPNRVDTQPGFPVQAGPGRIPAVQCGGIPEFTALDEREREGGAFMLMYRTSSIML